MGDGRTVDHRCEHQAEEEQADVRALRVLKHVEQVSRQHDVLVSVKGELGPSDRNVYGKWGRVQSQESCRERGSDSCPLPVHSEP
jgi:hypothetical protein